MTQKIRVLIGAWMLVGLPATTAAQQPARVSLEEAIRTALANSHDITAGEASVDFASQQVREAWSNVYPTVSANASYQRNLKVQQGFLPAQFFDPDAGPDDVVPVRFGSDNTWAAGMSFDQPLFELDVFVGVGAAGQFRNLESERLRGTTQGVVTAVRESYLNVLLAREDERLTRNSVERVRQTLDETRALNRAGLASAYDVLRLEVQLSNLEPNLRRAQNAVSARKRVLLIEMGRAPDLPIEPEGSLFQMVIDSVSANTDENARLLRFTGLPVDADLSLPELESIARGRRSELRQQRLSINLEEARLKSQRAEYFPSLSLFSTYNVTAQTNGQLFADFFGSANTRTETAVTGIRIEVPIFQGLARDARMQQTRSTLRQYEAQLERATKAVAVEIQTFLEQLDEAALRVGSQRGAVAQARRGFEIASAEYREGVGSQLQITDAEVALRESEFNYAQAVYDYLMARVRLDGALGTVPEVAGDLGVRAPEGGER